MSQAIDASGNLTGAPEHVAATLLASGATEEAPGGISSTVILGSSSSVPAHETPTPAEDEEETPAELITPDDLTDENVVLAEDASSPTTQQYLLQSPPNYKMELLHYIHGLEADGILDFPVFLQDGVNQSSQSSFLFLPLLK